MNPRAQNHPNPFEGKALRPLNVSDCIRRPRLQPMKTNAALHLFLNKVSTVFECTNVLRGFVLCACQASPSWLAVMRGLNVRIAHVASAHGLPLAAFQDRTGVPSSARALQFIDSGVTSQFSGFSYIGLKARSSDC